MLFISPNKGLRIYNEKGLLAQFTNGIFRTDDSGKIEELTNYPEFGKRYVSADSLPNNNRNNVVQGIRSSGSAVTPTSSVDAVDKDEIFNELVKITLRCMKSDGTYRTNAKEEDINRLNELKQLL